MYGDTDVPFDVAAWRDHERWEQQRAARQRGSDRVTAMLAGATLFAGMLSFLAACCSSPLERPVQEVWPGVREDAQLGVLARMDPDFMAQRGGEALSHEAAEARLERIDLFDQAVKRLAE